METSFLNIPEYSDYYPTEQGKETNYPKSLFPKRKLMNEQVFEKMDIDTLFFIFYSQKVKFHFHFLLLILIKNFQLNHILEYY